MTEPEIHDALHRIVPDDLSADGLAAGAHRKRRNRSRAVAGVSALALVALAIPVAMNLPNSGRPTVANPAESSTQRADATSQVTSGPHQDPLPVPETGPQVCARMAAESTPRENPGDVPANPTRAWLCGDAVGGQPGGQAGPLEPLTTDVAKVIGGFNALEKIDIATIMCTAEYRLTYRVILEYDGSGPRQLTGELHGCRTVNDGQTFRSGGAEFLTQLVGLWQAQRAAGGPAYHRWDAGCPSPNSLILAALADATSAMACLTTSARTVPRDRRRSPPCPLICSRWSRRGWRRARAFHSRRWIKPAFRSA